MQTLEELIQRTQPRLKGLILMTPFFIEPNRGDAMRAKMDQYGNVVRTLAAKYSQSLWIRRRRLIRADRVARYTALAGDRVHPNLTGHFVLARAFSQGSEYEW